LVDVARVQITVAPDCTRLAARCGIGPNPNESETLLARPPMPSDGVATVPAEDAPITAKTPLGDGGVRPRPLFGNENDVLGIGAVI
jgi:hypothetical protein